MSKKSSPRKAKLMQDTTDWGLSQKTKELALGDTDVQMDDSSPNYNDTSTEHLSNPDVHSAINVPAANTPDNQQVSDLPDMDLTIDGPEICEFQLPQSGSEPVSSSNASSCSSSMSTSTSSISTPGSSDSASSNGSMRDFVILHTDTDYESAQIFQDSLNTDVADDANITVDLFSEIDAGTTWLQSIGTLHDRYRYILLFVTDSLTNDRHCRFLNEILITLGLRDGGSKAERVVPVFTKRDECGILELSIILGIPYYKRTASSDMRSHLKIINNLVRSARDKFPL